MKRIITITTAILLLLPLWAQDEGTDVPAWKDDPDEISTLIRPGTGHGAYAGLSFGFTEIGGRSAIIMGARGSWIIGHSFGIGMGGYGFINEPLLNVAENRYSNLSGGYGGIVLEPIIAGKWPVHLSFPVTLGGGAVARSSFPEELFTMEPYDAYLEESALFLVAEPGVELEFNITRWLRLSAYGSYRFTTNINMLEITPGALRNWNAGVWIKVGRF